MKKITFLLVAMLAFCWQGHAQILTEGFESGAIPAGWTLEYVSGTLNWKYVAQNGNASITPRTGAYMAEFRNVTSGSATKLVTPALDLTTLSNPQLTFYYANVNWFGDIDELRVYYKSSGVGAWTQIGIDYTAEQTAWTEVKLTLPNPSNDYYIAFEGTSNWARGLNLDDVLVDEGPTCTPTVVDSFTVVDDCGNSQFSVDVVVSTVGDGTNITDGLGGTFPVVAGTVTAGPYTIGDTITLTVEHTDGACDFSGDFETGCTLPGEVCENAIVVGSLPYNTTDNTVNYGDDYSGSVGATGCGTTNNYLNGDDVVYAYTATSDTSIKVALSSIGSTYSGVFVYTDCADIGTACVAGFGNGTSTANYDFDVDVTNGTTYYIVISTWATPQSTAYTLDITENTCTAATVTIPANPIDNANCPTTVDVSISIDDLGDATSLTITAEDDMGNPAGTGGTVTATGIFTITNIPVPQTAWTIKIAHSSDITCDLEIGPFFIECPPANDDCAGANIISALPYNFSQTDVAGSTNNAGFITSCSATSAGSMNDGLWFTFTPVTSGTVDIVLSNVAGTFDPQMDIYSGSCGTFSCVASADTGGAGGGESIIAQAVTAGTQYFINVGYYSGINNLPEGSFDISVTGTFTLGIDIMDTNAFTYFPNPVKNTLQLNAQSNIQNVSIFNMLGQEVLRTAPNNVNSTVDMSALQTGAYFVKVTINDRTETVRVIKQ
jgi:hypothetical protein